MQTKAKAATAAGTGSTPSSITEALLNKQRADNASAASSEWVG